MNHTWKGKHGPLLIAEIGGNHEGNYEYAQKLTQLAAETNVDYIKFQLYSGNTLVNPIQNPARNKHFKKFELDKIQYIELAKFCSKKNIKFMASVWNTNYFPWIDDFIEVYKIGSGDLTAYPILEATSEKAKPIILSTGLSNLEDVIQSVNFIQKCNKIYESPNMLALLQCTSMYPIPNQDANLNVMHTLKLETGLTIGYSDHTVGHRALEVAYSMGAEILEFHFTDSRKNQTFRDHQVSLTKTETIDLIKSIKEINLLKGSFEKKILEIEGTHPITFRRAVYLSKDVKIGEEISKEHLIYLRPMHGIDTREFMQLIGKKAKIDIKAFQKLDFSFFI